MDYTKHLETRFRTLGNDMEPDVLSYVCKTDDCPDELANLIHDVHFDIFGGCLPNDWIYATIKEALEDLESDDIDNVSIESDVYNSDLYKWFGEPFAAELVNEVLEDNRSCADIYAVLGMAQYNAKYSIYQAVAAFLEDQKALINGGNNE